MTWPTQLVSSDQLVSTSACWAGLAGGSLVTWPTQLMRLQQLLLHMGIAREQAEGNLSKDDAIFLVKTGNHQDEQK